MVSIVMVHTGTAIVKFFFRKLKYVLIAHRVACAIELVKRVVNIVEIECRM